MKKTLAVILSAVVTIGSTVSAMAGTVFSDINNVPWSGAEAYITKVADLGLMVGEKTSDGTSIFRAKDSVTYSETVQLVYNILKNDKKASDSDARVIKWKPALEGYKIPQWAHQAVSYGLEKEIVTVKDLEGFIKNGNSANATREDVAVIFGRALSEDYPIKNNPLLDFNDRAKVTSSAAPYVNLLYELKILVGDDNKNFNPKNYINRAEMAVVTTKTYSVVTGEEINIGVGEITGTVIGVTDSGSKRTLEIKLSDGKIMKLTGTGSTPTTYEGKEISFAEITAGDNLTVTYSADTITKVIVNFDFIKASEESVSGTINYMTSERITINKNIGGSDVYNLSPLASIKLNNEDASVSQITRIIDNGVTVNVTVKLSGGIVTAVSAQGLEDTVQGVITKITNNEITIKRTGGTSKIYGISNYVTVRYEDKSSRLKEVTNAVSDGIEVYVVATLDKSGDVEKIAANISKDGGVYSGAVKKLTEERITIVDSEGKSTYYDIDKNAVAVFEEKSITLYSLVRKFDDGTALSAKIYLNSSGQVAKIDSSLEDNNLGTISSISQRDITIKTNSGIERKLLLDQDVVVRFGTETDLLTTLIDVYEKGKTEVTLTLNSKDVVVRIVADIDSKKYDVISGDVSAVGADSIKIGNKTIYISSSTTVKVDGKESSSSDIYKRYQRGEVLYARVAFSDNLARTITATVEEATGKVTNLVKGQITISTSSGQVTYDLTENKDLTIKIDGSRIDTDFSEFYSLWFIGKNNYDVELFFDDGKVIKILAKTL